MTSPARLGIRRVAMLSGRAQWGALFVLSLPVTLVLELMHLPAALLLGPMVAGVLLMLGGGAVRVPGVLFIAAQSLIGCLMARSMPPTLFGSMAQDWHLFAGGILTVTLVSNGLGWLLMRWKIMPGTTAIWGSAPGAAAAMTLLADAYGADARLVAFMQYLRVVCVAVTASLVARIWVGVDTTAATPSVDWFPPMQWLAFGQTLGLVASGVFATQVLRWPVAGLLLPLLLGVALHSLGVVHIFLPPWLLATAYAVVGWQIGLRFTRPVVAAALRALPVVLVSTLVLVALCGGVGALMAVWAGIDPLTAYLATSPGGADSVVIIAASSPVDVPFVTGMQTLRFLFVTLTGPAIARFLANRMPAGQPAT